MNKYLDIAPEVAEALAAGAGALACTAAETIHPGMSWESIEYIVNTAK